MYLVRVLNIRGLLDNMTPAQKGGGGGGENFYNFAGKHDSIFALR